MDRASGVVRGIARGMNVLGAASREAGLGLDIASQRAGVFDRAVQGVARSVRGTGGVLSGLGTMTGVAARGLGATARGIEAVAEELGHANRAYGAYRQGAAGATAATNNVFGRLQALNQQVLAGRQGLLGLSQAMSDVEQAQRAMGAQAGTAFAGLSRDIDALNARMLESVRASAALHRQVTQTAAAARQGGAGAAAAAANVPGLRGAAGGIRAGLGEAGDQIAALQARIGRFRAAQGPSRELTALTQRLTGLSQALEASAQQTDALDTSLNRIGQDLARLQQAESLARSVDNLKTAWQGLNQAWSQPAAQRASGQVSGLQTLMQGLQARAGQAANAVAGALYDMAGVADTIPGRLQAAFNVQAHVQRLQNALANIPLRLYDAAAAFDQFGTAAQTALGGVVSNVRRALAPLAPLAAAAGNLRSAFQSAWQSVQQAGQQFAAIPAHLAAAGAAFGAIGGHVHAAQVAFQQAHAIWTQGTQGMAAAVANLLHPTQQLAQVQQGLAQAGVVLQHAWAGLQTAGQTIQQGFQRLQQAGQNLAQAWQAVTFAGTAIGQGFQRLGQAGQALAQGFGGLHAAATRLGQAWGQFSGAAQVLGNAFGLLNQARQNAQQGFVNFGQALNQARQAITSVGGVLGGLHNALGGLMGVWQNSVQQVQNFYQHLQSLGGVIPAVQAGITGLGHAVQSLGQGFQHAGSAAGSFLDGLTSIGQAFQTVWNAARQAPSALGQVWANLRNIGQAAAGVVGAVFNVGRSLLSVAATAGSAILRNLPAIFQAAQQALSGLIGAARGAVTALQGVWNTVTGLAGAAARGVGNVLGFVASIVRLGDTRGPLERISGVFRDIFTTAAGVAVAKLGLNSIDGALKQLNETVIQSNQRFETWTSTITSFTGSTAIAADIVADLRREGDITPFKTEAIVQAGQQLIASAGGSKEALMGLMATAEELAALRPMQNLAGASFAIREAVAGDFESVVERFDISREAIARYRAQGETNINAVRKTIEEMGVSSQLVTNLARTFEGATSTIQSFFTETRRSLGAGLFTEISQGAQRFAQWIRTAGEAVYETAQRVGNVLGGMFRDIREGVEAAVRSLGGLGEGLQDALRAFQRGDFSGILSGLSLTFGRVWEGLLQQASGFAGRMIGVGQEAARNFIDGVLSGLGQGVQAVSGAVQSALVNLFGGTMLTEAELAGRQVGAGFTAEVGNAVEATSGDIAQHMASISDALKIPLEGTAGARMSEEAARVKRDREELIQGQEDARKRIGLIERKNFEDNVKYETARRNATRQAQKEVDDLQKKLDTLGREGIPGLAITAQQLDDFLLDIQTANRDAPGNVVSPEMIESVKRFREEFVVNGRIMDNERARMAAAALDTEALVARLRAPGAVQPEPPKIVPPDFNAIRRNGFLASAEFQEAFQGGLETGLTPIQQITNNMVSTMTLAGGKINEAWSLQRARDELSAAFGQTDRLQSLIRNLERPLSQLEATAGGLQQELGIVNFQMQGIRDAAEAAARPLQRQLRDLEAQRDVALRIRAAELELEQTGIEMQILARGRLQIEREALNVRLQGLNRDRDRITLGREYERMQRRVAGYEGVPQEALSRRQRLRLIDRDILGTRLELLEKEGEEAELDPLKRRLAEVELEERQTNAIARRNDLLLDIQKIPIERDLRNITREAENLLAPLEADERALNRQLSAVQLMRGEFQGLQRDAQNALETARAASQQQVQPRERIEQRLTDEQIAAMRDRLQTVGGAIGRDLLNGMGDYFRNNFAATLLASIGLVGGFAFLGPVGSLIGIALGVAIGDGLKKQLEAQNIGLPELQTRFNNWATEAALTLEPALTGILRVLRSLGTVATDFWTQLDKQDLMDNVGRAFQNIGRAITSVMDTMTLFTGRNADAQDGMRDTRSVGTRLADAFNLVADAVVWLTDKFAGFFEAIERFVHWWQRSQLIVGLQDLADLISTIGVLMDRMAGIGGERSEMGQIWAAYGERAAGREFIRRRGVLPEEAGLGGARAGPQGAGAAPGDAQRQALRDEWNRITAEQRRIEADEKVLVARRKAASDEMTEARARQLALEAQAVAAAGEGRGADAAALTEQARAEQARAAEAAGRYQEARERLEINDRVLDEVTAKAMEANRKIWSGVIDRAAEASAQPPPPAPAGPPGPPAAPAGAARTAQGTRREGAPIVGVVGDILSDIGTLANDLTDAEARREAGDAARAARLRERAQAAGAGAPGTAGAFEQAGVDSGVGYAEGITGTITEAEAASRGLGNASVGALSETLMVQSPSVVMRNIGVDAVAGYVEGITSQFGVVGDAFRQLAGIGPQALGEAGALPAPAGGGGGGGAVPPVQVTVQINGPIIGTVQANDAEQREALFTDLQNRLGALLQAAGAQVAEQVIAMITGSAERAEPRAPAFLPGVVPGLMPA